MHQQLKSLKKHKMTHKQKAQLSFGMSIFFGLMAIISIAKFEAEGSVLLSIYAIVSIILAYLYNLKSKQQ